MIVIKYLWYKWEFKVMNYDIVKLESQILEGIQTHFLTLMLQIFAKKTIKRLYRIC